jgi:class 3 adenylate cyclase/tetratricopeptide (TPR) repeat protein
VSLDVRKWLEAGGFGQYADLFEAHQIDADALCGMSEQHLRELGIPLGPRIKLLAALARAPLEFGRETSAERRRLTVMFADLVGSTALSGRLDPEEMRSVMRAYHDVVDGVVSHYGAHVAQYLGDGVMVYFGYPRSHEDDAERAVRAGLDIAREIAEVRTPAGERLAVRVGIATGLVVVGDLLGSGPARQHAVVGETPNLAHRLQGLAGPGEVVVAERTRALIGDVFELHELGPQQLHGIAAPVLAYRVADERLVETRFDARRSTQLEPMVGRDGELALLRDRWRSACAGEGQIVQLTGEAGIGKSRIVRALQDSLSGEPHFRVHNQCSPYHADSALFPAIQQITRAARISSADDARTRLDRLETLLARAAREDVALIAALLGIDTAGRYGRMGLTPQQQRLRTFDALMGQIVGLASSRPVLWVLEDAHWIDPTTLELVERCISTAGKIRMLAIITARPEFQHDLGTHRHLTRLTLNRLGRVQVAAMVGNLARGKALPEELVREIAMRTDGVPLFVEELTKAVLESALVREIGGAYVLDGPLQQLSVPASLHDSLMARLDRLQPLKEVAQTAACIGREFSFALLARVCRMDEPALRASLAQLEKAELIFQRGPAHEPRYAFKHALVRDAAYESLLRERRRQIHTQLVAALEGSPEVAAEIIAQHATAAGLMEKAIDYWEKAAALAVARPAYKEAIAHLTQAIRLAEKMGDARAWVERRLLLLVALGQASIPLRGYSHSQTVAIFTRAGELAAAMDDAPRRFSIMYATWVALYVRGEQDKALELARSMLERARAQGNDGHRLTALRTLAISQMITGTPAAAAATFGEVDALAEALRQRSQEQRIAVADRFAADPEIATQFHVCLTLWSLGRVREARQLVERAVQAARSMGHVHTLGHALTHGAIVAVVCRYAEEAQSLSAEAMEFARRHDMELWQGYGSILHGYALALKNDFTGSAASMDKGLSALARTQTGAMVPMHRAMHACTLAMLGRHADAEEQATMVRAELRSGSERYFWPECHRLLGDYLRLCADTQPGQVEAAYMAAVSLARQQGARCWELGAMLSLARLWTEQGERGKALDLLVPAGSAFANLADLPVYREAVALAKELRS